MALELYGHQARACNNLKEMYKNHRSAGAMMVTGGGKSFVAMHQMITAGNNPNYHGISEVVGEDGRQKVEYDIVDGVVNNAEILYLSPTTDIAVQIQKDIVEYVLGYSGKEVAKFSMSQIEELVKNAFPNLHFACYQGLNSNVLYRDKNGVEVDIDNATPDLVILDEVHRSGAKTFKPAVGRLLGYKIEEPDFSGKEKITKISNASEGKENIQLLSISATPERDVDDVDMIRYWNELIGKYTEEELDNREDFAIILGLPEAVRQGIVTPPEIIAFDANLVDTEEYKYLVSQISNHKIAPSMRKEFEERVRLINKSIFGEGYEDFHKLAAEEQAKIKLEKNASVMKKAIDEGKLNIHGKYIVFSKSRKFVDGQAIEEQEEGSTQKGEDHEAIKHLKGQFEIVKNMITKALGREPEIDEKYLSSQGLSGKTNKDNLVEFDNKEVTEDSILSFLTATQKLDEGVHVKYLTGAFMLKPIREAGENISLRGQSIRFLQEIGRTMSAGTKEPRVVFDYCNNVYRQNISKVLTEDQMIDAFSLNPNQKLLADTYRMMSEKILPNGQLTDEYMDLVDILDILRGYHCPLHADIIDGKLSDVLGRAEFIEHRDEIVEKIKGLGKFGSKKSLDSYPIGRKLDKARALLNSKTLKEDVGKVFSTFNIKELAELGIFDRISRKGMEAYENGCLRIDENGYVVGSNLRNLIFQHVETGTPYNPEGVDIKGHREGQFNEITGRDSGGFDIRGFNEEGIHRVTGTIHDERGFMADGINILTGTRCDMLGFNDEGYKKFGFVDVDPKTQKGREINDVVVDRNGLFHQVFIDPETGKPDYSKISPIGEQYYQLSNGLKIDSHGFLSTRSENLYTKAEFRTGNGRGSLSQFRIIRRKGIEDGKVIDYVTAYDKNGNAFSGYDVNHLSPCSKSPYAEVPGRRPVDIDGFDKNGFNYRGVHRDTGTRYDPKGRTVRDCSDRCLRAEQTIELLTKVGQITKEFCDAYGLDSDGKDIITGTQADIYGFTVLNRGDSKFENEPNRFGFIAREIPVHVFNGPGPVIKEKYKTIGGKQLNILGTDPFGKKPDGKMHEALNVLRNYTEACIEGEMGDEEYFETVARERKMLVKEVKQELIVGMNKAFELYRLCPYICQDRGVKSTFDKIFRASPDKLKDKVFIRCPKLRSTLGRDIADITQRIRQLQDGIDRKDILEDKKEKLRREKKELMEKLVGLRTLHNKGKGDGR